MSKALLQELETQKKAFNSQLDGIRFIKNKEALRLRHEADKLKYVKKNSLKAVMHDNLPSKSEVFEAYSRRFKSAWKDPGYKSDEFSKVPILKPRHLSSWQKDKCTQPARNNEPVPANKGFKIRHQPEEFTEGRRDKLYPKRFQGFLSQKEEEYLEFTTRKSKFAKLDYDIRREKLIEDNKEVFRLVNTVQNQQFGHGLHSTWEKTVKEKNWNRP